MATALNLNKLLKGDTEFKTEEERQIEIGKHLLKLIPTKPKKFLKIKINDEFYPLRKEQIKKILVDNNLVSGDYDNALDEFVKGSYKLRKHPTERLRFEELKNNGNVLYQPFISWFDGFA